MVFARDPKNLVPIMTGYNTPLGVVTSSPPYDGHHGWCVFDNTPQTYFNPINNDWFLQYKFEKVQIVTYYNLIPKQVTIAYPQDWTLQGSNDGLTYITLDSRSGITAWSIGKLTFTFTNTAPYLFYRLNIKNAKAGYLELQGFEMCGEPFTIHKYPQAWAGGV